MITPIRNHKSQEFDLFIAALGYEKRAITVSQTVFPKIKKGVAIQFIERNVLNFQRNQSWYEQAKFEIVSKAGVGFTARISEIIQTMDAQGNQLEIGIDISSMSRPMIATLVHLLNGEGAKANVTFFYSPAKFVAPSQEHSPITISEPVTPDFAGWYSDISKPALAIVGLGYEYDYSYGILEYLEPYDAWAFFPTGEDPQYDHKVWSINRDMINLIGKERIYTYRVDDPYDCFLRLESFLSHASAVGRPILIPFGPKIFALISMVVAVGYLPNISVWRVSGDQSGEPVDRVPNGKIVEFSVAFTPNLKEEGQSTAGT